nr:MULTISPECIES: amidohydrolase family protein [Pseudofrankia]
MGRIFDCDQHMYETLDAFTRHIAPEWAHRTVKPVTLENGDEAILMGERILVAVEPEFRKAYKPGSLKEMLKQMSTGAPTETYMFEPMRDVYQDRDARLREMDAQGLDATIMYPGSWGLMAEAYITRPDALYANLRSFNTYMNEQWGFDHKGRIYAPATIALKDRDLAVKELDQVLADGARFILMTTGPAYGRSPGDPYFDPIWARINEAKATVCYHITEAYYNANLAPAWGHEPDPIHFRMSAWQWQNTYGERPITETLSALVFDNLFGRFPEIRVLASEFGASWVPHFVRHMDKSRGMGRNGPWIGGQLDRRPSEVFRDHIRVVPYPEDDPVEIIRRLGFHDSIVMGSDWPHAEGLASPADFRNLLDGLDEQVTEDVMYNTAAQLVAH